MAASLARLIGPHARATGGHTALVHGTRAALTAAPDPDEGQVPVAFVVLRDGRHASADELIAFLRERIAGYKIPVRIHFLQALPLTASRKVAHRELREPS